MGYYYHPTFGPHEGDPIGGIESAEITQAQFEAKNAEWNAAHNAPAQLTDLAATKLIAINAGKNAALDGGFLHDGTLFDSDYKARLAYLELAFKLGQNPAYSTGWKASTGVWVTMDAALFAAVQPAYEAHIQDCFQWQAAREMEVAAAETAGDVLAISEVMG